MSFADSLTAREWIFTPDELRARRAKATAVDGALNPNDPEEQNLRLTVDEDWGISEYWTHQFAAMCHAAAPDMPIKVKGTAIGYYRRYFVDHSVNNPENDPGPIMLASIFLACKTEEFRSVTFAHLKRTFDAQKSLNVDNVKHVELQLLQGIRFHLNIYHPFRPAAAFFTDFQKYLVDVKKFTPEQVHWFTEGLHKINEHVLLPAIAQTEAMLLFAPSVLAIAGLKKYFEQHHADVVPLFQEYLEQFLQSESARVFADVDAAHPFLGPPPADKSIVQKNNKKVKEYFKWRQFRLTALPPTHPVQPHIPLDPPVALQPTLEAATSHLNAE